MKKNILVTTLLCFSMLTACTNQSMSNNKTEQVQNKDIVGMNDDKVGTNDNSVVTNGDIANDSNNTSRENNNTSKENNNTVKESNSQTADRELTKDELKSFTRLVNSKENYGFLLSDYALPEEVDLSKVLYNGAGIETDSLSQDERKAYLKAINESELYTDYNRLTTKQIDSFLQEKMGILFSDVKTKLDWNYLSDYDIWMSQHGDTNYVAFTCAKGKQTGKDTFILECAAEGEYVSDCELTLKKIGDTYQFVSNKFINKIQNANSIWQIEDQIFEVNLDGWGDVMFVSYEPDTTMFPDKDATFALLDGNEVVFTFPGMEENNLRGSWTFYSVKAVAFKDYNNDSIKDVIIINEYAASAGPTVAQGFDEVRLYTQYGGNKEFVLDCDTTDYLNKEGYNLSISEVLEKACSFDRSDSAENRK